MTVMIRTRVVTGDSVLGVTSGVNPVPDHWDTQARSADIVVVGTGDVPGSEWGQLRDLLPTLRSQTSPSPVL